MVFPFYHPSHPSAKAIQKHAMYKLCVNLNMDNHRSGFFQGDSGPKTKSTTCAAKKLESQTTCISICMSAMKRLDLTASSVQVPACVNSPCLGATRNVKLDVLQFMSVEISEAKKLNILEVGFKKNKNL